MKTVLFVIAICLGTRALAQDMEDTPEATPAPAAAPSPATAPTAQKPAKTVKEQGSGDTYNFYFQKGEGPKEVQQGGAQVVHAEPAPTPAPAPVVQTPAPVPVQMTDEWTTPRFELQGLYLMTPSKPGHGFALGGQFNMNSWLGLQIHLMSLQIDDEETSTSSFSAFGTDNTTTKLSATGGSAALAFMPISAGRVRVAGLLGAMMVSESKDTTESSFSAQDGINSSNHSERKTKVLPFAGISASANINHSLAVIGMVKIANDQYSQIGLGIAKTF